MMPYIPEDIDILHTVLKFEHEHDIVGGSGGGVGIYRVLPLVFESSRTAMVLMCFTNSGGGDGQVQVNAQSCSPLILVRYSKAQRKSCLGSSFSHTE